MNFAKGAGMLVGVISLAVMIFTPSDEKPRPFPVERADPRSAVPASNSVEDVGDDWEYEEEEGDDWDYEEEDNGGFVFGEPLTYGEPIAQPQVGSLTPGLPRAEGPEVPGASTAGKEAE